MNKIVFDASALLALLNQESGYEIAEQYLPNSIMSAVNLAEVITVLVDIGVQQQEAQAVVSELIKECVDFDQNQAYTTAGLRKITKAKGLSLGDRACLALAQRENLPVLTADKAWSGLNHLVKIIFIR